MAKHKKDIGLQYIQKLHLSTFRSLSAMRAEMTRKFGQERSMTYLEGIIGEKMPDVAKETGPYYNAHFRDIELGRFISGAQDTDILRRAANWIHDHREAFGQEILEIGSGAGHMTAILAMEFPDRHITSVEINEGPLSAASALIEELGLTNVTFVHADIHDYAKDHPGEADTVYSMRVLDENYRFEGLGNPGPQPLDVTLSRFLVPAGLSYACTLSRAAAPDGTLITVQFRDAGPHATEGWMSDLLCTGWTIDESTLCQVTCRRIDQTTPMELFVCRDRRRVDLDELLALDVEHLARRSADSVRQVLELRGRQLHLPDQPGSQYQGEEADIACALMRGELISGLGVFDRDGQLNGKFALYAQKGAPGCYVSLTASREATDAQLHLQEEDRQEFQQTLVMAREGKDPGISRKLRQLDMHLLWLSTDPGTGLEVAAED